MGSFAVSTEDLQALVSSLSALVDELGQAGSFSPDVGSAGSPNVESSMQSFFSEWSDGLHKIQENIDEFTERLSVAAQKYQGTDSSIASAFGG